MNKSIPHTNILREKQKALELDITKIYNMFLIKQPEYKFTDDIALDKAMTDDDIEGIELQIEDCFGINPTNENGYDYYAKLVGVSKEGGIYIVEENDVKTARWIKFTDVYSMHDKISIVNAMEIEFKS